MTLQDQIRERWGQYGDWGAAGQDQVSALARLLQENGVSDLSQFQLKARDYNIPGKTEYVDGVNEQGERTTPDRSGTAFDAFYGGKQLGFLGDINRDGSYSARPKSQTPGLEAIGLLGSMDDGSGNGNMLGWSAQGGGNTAFAVRKGPNGEPVIVPTWGSSSQSTYQDLRATALMLAGATGAYFAPAEGAAGAAATGALKGGGTAIAGNMLFGNGDPDSIVKAGLTGAATGAISGGAKAYGADQGWNPALTKAATNVGLTVARGGDVGTALKSAAINGGLGLLGNGGNNLNNVSGDALSEDNIVRFDGGNNMGDQFDWESWLQEQIDGSNLTTDPGSYFNDVVNTVDPSGSNLTTDPGSHFNDVNTTDPSGEPVYSNEGNNYPTVDSTQGPGGSPVNSSGAPDISDYIKSAIQRVFTGGSNAPGNGNNNPLWPMLLGGLLGAKSSGDKTQTVQREPWKPAQPYLEALLREGADLYGKYKAQPFNDAQKAGYNNMAGILDIANRNAPGLLSGFQANASGANQFVRGQPRGLIGSTFNPSPAEWNPQSFGRFGG